MAEIPILQRCVLDFFASHEAIQFFILRGSDYTIRMGQMLSRALLLEICKKEIHNIYLPASLTSPGSLLETQIFRPQSDWKHYRSCSNYKH